MIASLLLALALSADAAVEEVPLPECKVGPVAKRFGDSDWLVYSCADAESILVEAATGSAAFPFFFLVTPKESGVRLYGDGPGEVNAAKAAFVELDRLTPADVAAIVGETRAVTQK